MKIGLARRGYSATGGAENYLLRLADALESAGHAPVLFANPDWPRARWPAHREFVVIDRGGPSYFAARLAQLADEHCDRLFSLERVLRCDCYRAGDGVHRAWLERRARVESPWRVRLRRWNPKHRQILALERSLYGQGGARAIIANSRLVRDEILQHYGGSPERIHVVHNGLPAAAFQPAPPGLRERTRAAWGLAENDYAVLFAGTGWERKGLSVALNGWWRMREKAASVNMIVAGRGNPRRYMTRLPRGAQKRVRFLGPVSDMAACYAAADMFVAPTLYDPFSNACLEALAAGLPVLTTPDNGFSEILTPGRDGEIIATTDPDAWAAALAAWADPGRRRAARADCTAKASAFTMDANVRRTLDILLGR